MGLLDKLRGGGAAAKKDVTTREGYLSAKGI
jgi:hypothetical protein